MDPMKEKNNKLLLKTRSKKLTRLKALIKNNTDYSMLSKKKIILFNTQPDHNKYDEKKFQKKQKDLFKKAKYLEEENKIFSNLYSVTKEIYPKKIEETFKDLIQAYRDKGYIIPELSEKKNIFDPNPLLETSKNIEQFYLYHQRAKNKYKSIENPEKHLDFIKSEKILTEKNIDKFKRLNSENSENFKDNISSLNINNRSGNINDIQNKINTNTFRKFHQRLINNSDNINNHIRKNKLIINKKKSTNSIKNLLWDAVSRRTSNLSNKNKSQSYKTFSVIKSDYNENIKNEIKKIENTIKNLKTLDIDMDKPSEILSQKFCNLHHNCDSKKYFTRPSLLTERVIGSSKTNITNSSKSSIFKSNSNSFVKPNRKIQKYNSTKRIFHRNDLINKNSIKTFIETKINMNNLYDKLMKEKNHSKFLEMLDGVNLRQFQPNKLENIIKKYCSQFLGYNEEQIKNVIKVKNPYVQINKLVTNTIKKSKFSNDFTNMVGKEKVRNLLKNFNEKADSLEKLLIEKRAEIEFYEKDE